MSEIRLLIDTSERVGQVGLSVDRGVPHAVRLDEQRRHARDLTVEIHRLLQAASVAWSDFTAIHVCIGPGGYTGLRVGLATAKTLAYATGVPLVAVPSFEAIAAVAPPEAEQLWILADALQGELYLQRFQHHQPLDELRIVAAKDWLPWATPAVWLSGPGVRAYADQLPCGVNLVPEELRSVTLAGLLQAGCTRRPLASHEVMALEPLYLRGSSAEEKGKREGRLGPPGAVS